MLQKIPSAEFMILGDFKTQHAETLGSRTTNYAGRSFHDFALEYGLTQLVTSHTYVPDVDDHLSSLLDLLLTTIRFQ